MTYLEIVNSILVRLREPTVSTVGLDAYSTLIGKFVNDAKRQVEDAYDWNVLGQEKTVTTTSGTYVYSLTGAGQKFRESSSPLNTTSNVVMRNISVADMRQKQNFTPIVTNIPAQYCFEGIGWRVVHRGLFHPESRVGFIWIRWAITVFFKRMITVFEINRNVLRCNRATFAS